MEDEHVAARPLMESHQGDCVHMFGVFDGHGGKRCSAFLKQSLAAAVKQSLSGVSDSVEDAIRNAFLQTDTRFLQGDSSSETREEGSTAVVVVIIGSTLYCANTGDSRAVLCRGGSDVKALSHDHKPNRPDEKQRIERLGGCVLYNRVMGRLGVSRAFGDKSLKEYVTAEPEIVSLQLKEGTSC